MCVLWHPHDSSSPWSSQCWRGPPIILLGYHLYTVHIPCNPRAHRCHYHDLWWHVCQQIFLPHSLPWWESLVWMLTVLRPSSCVISAYLKFHCGLSYSKFLLWLWQCSETENFQQHSLGPYSYRQDTERTTLKSFREKNPM